VEPRDPRVFATQQLGGEVTQGADHRRLDELHLAAQIALAGLDLVGLRVPVVGGPTFQNVGDEDIGPGQADLLQKLVQQLSGLPHERQALLVLVGPGGLADEHQLGIGVAGPEDDVGAGLVQRTADALPGLLEDGLQQLPPLCGACHGTGC
jgi:hypothetical protein